MARFKVFTAEQLAEMFFDTRKRAQVRLHRLHELGVLDRFQPYRQGWGSSPYHYVLGPVGAEMAAAATDEDDRRPARRPSATGLALGRPRDLARLRTVNGFYASLVGHARRHPEARLLDWMTAEEAARWSNGMVEPDAFGEWAEGDRSVEFFLVVDRGGPIEAFVADLSRYERFDVERGISALVFIACRSQRRETVLREAVMGRRTLATAGELLAGSFAPDHSAWRVDGDGESRHSFRSVCAAYELPPDEPSPRAWLYSRRDLW